MELGNYRSVSLMLPLEDLVESVSNVDNGDTHEIPKGFMTNFSTKDFWLN